MARQNKKLSKEWDDHYLSVAIARALSPESRQPDLFPAARPKDISDHYLAHEWDECNRA